MRTKSVALRARLTSQMVFALVELPLLGFLLSPDRTRALTARFNEWMARRRRTIVAVVAGAIGVYLLVSGLAEL